MNDEGMMDKMWLYRAAPIRQPSYGFYITTLGRMQENYGHTNRMDFITVGFPGPPWYSIRQVRYPKKTGGLKSSLFAMNSNMILASDAAG
jgi:hypothetical protein